MKRKDKISAGILVAVLLIGFFTGLYFIIAETSESIAVIPVYGVITYKNSNYTEYTNPDEIKEFIKEANNDPSIKAIVLDINSPGGTPVASEELMKAIKDSKKPIVSWISDTGTSGAYLAASASDKIVASPSSWVGSIGVSLELTDLSGMYGQMGINKYAIKAGEYKDLGSDYRPITEEERQMLQDMVNEEYDYFISTVAKNRNLKVDYVRSLAEGKIYTGRQAANNKLVDSIGFKDDAMKIAAELGGVKGEYNIITFTRPNIFKRLLGNLYQGIISKFSGNSVSTPTLVY